MNKQKINIAFCFDNNFLKPATVAITSLLCSAKRECCYDIFIVQKTLSQSEKGQLNELVIKISPNSTLTFLSPDEQYDKALITIRHISISTYYRLLLPELLPHIDKILYLDTDIIILDDLRDLYNRNFDGNLLIGALDNSNITLMWCLNHFSESVLPLKKGKYINAGVLLMNLRGLRDAKLKEQWLALSKMEGYPCQDQSILNYTCEGKIGYIPLKYNYGFLWEQTLKMAINERIVTQQEFEDAKRQPVIYHYIGKNKPWKTGCPYSDIWWKYAKTADKYLNSNIENQ